MDYKIKGYKPEKLFNFFEEICAIPHGSSNEKELSDFLVKFAKQRGLWVKQDELYNVVIKKPASQDKKNAPTVMLQGHIDMVCEKLASSKHNFEIDGLELKIKDDFLFANNTTLGADNGVAVALMMTILDDNTLSHPEIECVFTTQEEIGLNGASHLDKSILNSKIMINLDSEEEGVATVSCAGGMRYSMLKNIQTSTQNGHVLSLEIRGLIGGHSGMDIDKERTNAIKTMAKTVKTLMQKTSGQLILFCGGTKDNAIPRECDAKLLYIDKTELENAICIAKDIKKELLNEIKSFEPDFSINIIKSENITTENVINTQDANEFINALCICPNGVRKRNIKQGNFVVSSLNLGIAQTTPNLLKLVFAPRSCVQSLQNETVQSLDIIAQTFNFSKEISGIYSGWEFNENSYIRNVFCSSYQKLFNDEMKIEAIHAGLECGIFCESIKGLDAIAVGPSIFKCHTPEENLSLKSLERFYELLKDTLATLT